MTTAAMATIATVEAARITACFYHAACEANLTGGRNASRPRDARAPAVQFGEAIDRRLVGPGALIG